MRAYTSLIFLAFAVSGFVCQAEEERNVWPLFVEQKNETSPETGTWSGAGPFLFSQPVDPQAFNGSTRARGMRPFYLAAATPAGQTQQAFFLYPLFSYRRMVDGYGWSVFSLVNHYATQASPASETQRGFDLWPFYFSRDTGNAESSYHAVLPLYGNVKHRFGQDRLSWILFPLYGRFEKNRVTTLTTPWPFVKIMSGQDNHGFDLWPVFGFRWKAQVYREQFFLWPLAYRQERELSAPRTDLRAGFLPFYAMARTPEFRSETYLWPFFGYTDRVAPYQYHQTDYLWPFLVQGRGPDRYVNRWGPVYTHSIIKGTDKRWILWPLWREQTWIDGPLRHTKRQFLYFIYNDTEQRSVSNPSLPTAHKSHYWPFLSVWDNGSGQKQIQALSPLEVFFPDNDPVRLLYTPFFALYRYSRTSPDRVEHSAFWKLVTYRRHSEHRELHLGPLYSQETEGASQRIALGNGLIALSREDAGHWHLSFFDFKRRVAIRATGASVP